jgi:hypothetical protein
MKKNEITENDILQISNDKLGILYWEFQLGVGLQYEYVENDNGRFSAPYPKMGKELWKAFKYELYEVFCVTNSGTPREWLNDIVTGDIRNLIIGISSVITTKYEVTLGIAVPLAALVIKTGVLNYCANPPKKSKRTVSEILSDKNQK